VTIDKTGTLTTGTPRLTSVTALDERYSEDDVLRIAAGAEQFSEHPLGRAVVAAARARGLAYGGATDFQALPGRGVRARIAERTVEVLSPRAFHDNPPAARDLERRGTTAVLVIVEATAVGVLGLDDTVRDGTDAVIATIAAITSSPPVLLTGDTRPAAEHLAAQVGITEVRAELLPDEKVAVVRQLETDGHRVLFVGDGINDAPAMATAHTSIAMGRGGADLTVETADAVTVRDELATIPAVLLLARRARRVVVANLVIAAIFISGLVAWDLFGRLPLPLGVAGHEGSTIIVALNGLRLLRSSAWRSAISCPP
jgi:cation-transporting P-type ATPase D